MVVSAGGTSEPIDPVRFISNRSSGKQGHAVAEAAAARGADVVLVTTANRPASAGIVVIPVETAAEMEQAMLEHGTGADVVVMAAAVADFRAKRPADTKLSKVRRRARARARAHPRHPLGARTAPARRAR